MRSVTAAALAAAVGLALSACAAKATQIRGPDGALWWSITCRRTQANCYKEAGDLCPYGYAVADQSGHAGTFVSVNQGSAVAVPVYRGEMLVQCRGRKVANPE